MPGHPCGTRAAYQAGCTCLPCRAAEATYRSQLRRRHALGKLPLGALVDATVTWRFVLALQREGVRKSDLAKRLGLVWPVLHLHPRRVRRRTALKIRRIYRQVMGLNRPE